MGGACDASTVCQQHAGCFQRNRKQRRNDRQSAKRSGKPPPVSQRRLFNIAARRRQSNTRAGRNLPFYACYTRVKMVTASPLCIALWLGSISLFCVHQWVPFHISGCTSHQHPHLVDEVQISTENKARAANRPQHTTPSSHGVFHAHVSSLYLSHSLSLSCSAGFMIWPLCVCEASAALSLVSPTQNLSTGLAVVGVVVIARSIRLVRDEDTRSQFLNSFPSL